MGTKKQYAKHWIKKSTVDWSEIANLKLEYSPWYPLCFQAREMFGSKLKSDGDTIECQSCYVETAAR